MEVEKEKREFESRLSALEGQVMEEAERLNEAALAEKEAEGWSVSTNSCIKVWSHRSPATVLYEFVWFPHPLLQVLYTTSSFMGVIGSEFVQNYLGQRWYMA